MSQQTTSPEATRPVESNPPLPHHAMPGPSNERAAAAEARLQARGPVDGRSVNQIERDIAARQARIAVSVAELRDRVSPKQVIRRKKEQVLEALDRRTGGRTLEAAGAVAGAAIVLVVIVAVAKRKRSD